MARFAIGGVLPVARIGFGALRITGPHLWGEPRDVPAMLALLRRAIALGVTLIDTADSYGPETSEALIRRALHPYPADLVIATKAGLARPAPDEWIPLGRPEYLIQQARLSARRLGVERIALWQLHRVDPKVPADEQFDAIRFLIETGVIAYAGLSEVDVATVDAARRYFPVATVQNLYNPMDRRSEALLDYCGTHGIGFIPFYPLGRGKLAGGSEAAGALEVVARARGVPATQVALAWLLRRSPNILVIPGTSSIAHLEQNMAAARLRLTDEEFAAIDAWGRALPPAAYR
ncbi:MAG: aldo/keto reductase [Sphingomonas bacterium]